MLFRSLHIHPPARELVDTPVDKIFPLLQPNVDKWR